MDVSSLHAQQDFMRVMIVFAKIVAVVGGNEREYRALFSRRKQVGVNFLFQLQPLILDFEERNCLAAERYPDIAKRSPCAASYLLGHQMARRPHRQGIRRTRSDPCVVLRQKILADPRFAIKTMERRLGGNAHQVTVAFLVLR